jgi:precorrin-3B C17-methyltransferase
LSIGVDGWRRALVDTIPSAGIDAAALDLAATASQIFDALSEAEIAPCHVACRREPSALLDEALGWVGSRLRMRSPGVRLADLSLADARITADRETVLILGAAWHVMPPAPRLYAPTASAFQAARGLGSWTRRARRSVGSSPVQPRPAPMCCLGPGRARPRRPI